MIIGVINTKGGVGKTTSAIYLATAFVDLGYDVAVIDLDQQGSASRWADIATEDATPLPFPVEVSNVGRLKNAATRGRHDSVIILDTPPGDTRVITAAIDVSDFVVIPTQASRIEVDRVWETLPSLAHLPHGVLITSARLGTNNLDAAVSALKGQGVGVFQAKIPLRESIRNSFGTQVLKTEGYEFVAQDIAEELA